MEIRVTGAEQLASLGAEFKVQGHGGFRKEMLAEFRLEAKPLVTAVRSSAVETLPRSGGLGELVSQSRIRSATRLTGKAVGVRIVANNRIGLRRINAGSVRHPLFGNRKFWYGQNVRAGWFDRPLEEGAVPLRYRLGNAMDRTAAKIERAA